MRRGVRGILLVEWQYLVSINLHLDLNLNLTYFRLCFLASVGIVTVLPSPLLLRNARRVAPMLQLNHQFSARFYLSEHHCLFHMYNCNLFAIEHYWDGALLAPLGNSTAASPSSTAPSSPKPSRPLASAPATPAPVLAPSVDCL